MDIILVLNWLRKYDGVILCAMRAIRLTKKDGTMVELIETTLADQASLLDEVQGTSLDEIRVVQEYTDEFFEELLHMPSDRHIKFIIDLVLGTPPISMRSLGIP
jgi:hypothetical protein